MLLDLRQRTHQLTVPVIAGTVMLVDCDIRLPADQLAFAVVAVRIMGVPLIAAR
jgi:hypothetical protein